MINETLKDLSQFGGEEVPFSGDLHVTRPNSVPALLDKLCKETPEVPNQAANSAPATPKNRCRIPSSPGGTFGAAPAWTKKNRVQALRNKLTELKENEQKEESGRENSTSNTSVNSHRCKQQVIQYFKERGRKCQRFYRTLVGVSAVTTAFIVTVAPILYHSFLAVLAQSFDILPVPWLDWAVLFTASMGSWCNLAVYWGVNYRR
jgi:hypothetical protein